MYSVIIKPDGSAGYSVGADKQIRHWRIGGDGKQLRTGGGHGDEIFKIALTPDGKTLATGSADKSVRLWESEKLANVKTLTGLTDFVYAIAFSSDGKRIAARRLRRQSADLDRGRRQAGDWFLG